MFRTRYVCQACSVHLTRADFEHSTWTTLTALALPYLVVLQARPQNMLTAVKQRARLVDVLWEVTGDTSVDSSWYGKRGLVAAVYGSTELYMLTDFSPGTCHLF
jgi:rpsU-divergently transcribed protein